MKPLCYFTFLCSLSFLSAVLSIDCNERQYRWPLDQPKFCCDKCPPGTRMDWRSSDSCDVTCIPCVGERYIDVYNEEPSCEVCENCDKTNMEYRLVCNATHNAVCGCKADYRCKDPSCTQCEPIPTTTTTKPTTLPPSATALKPETLTTLWTTPQPVREQMWFLVIIALLCAAIALVVVPKIKPFLRWITSNHGYLLAREPAPVPPHSESEDEEVSKPVQEVRGKCEV